VRDRDGGDFKQHVPLGRTGLTLSRLGMASGYGVPAAAIVGKGFFLRRFVGMSSHERPLFGKIARGEVDIPVDVCLTADEMARIVRIGDHIHRPG